MKFERVESFLGPLVDDKGHHYGEMDDGFVSFGDVSRNLLQKQSQYASFYIDGRADGYPKLGAGLRFNGIEDGNYHRIGIHPEDIDEFVRRIHAYRSYQSGVVKDDNGNVYELADVNIRALWSYLDEVGAFDTLWAAAESE